MKMPHNHRKARRLPSKVLKGRQALLQRRKKHRSQLLEAWRAAQVRARGYFEQMPSSSCLPTVLFSPVCNSCCTLVLDAKSWLVISLPAYIFDPPGSITSQLHAEQVMTLSATKYCWKLLVAMQRQAASVGRSRALWSIVKERRSQKRFGRKSLMKQQTKLWTRPILLRVSPIFSSQVCCALLKRKTVRAAEHHRMAYLKQAKRPIYHSWLSTNNAAIV